MDRNNFIQTGVLITRRLLKKSAIGFCLLAIFILTGNTSAQTPDFVWAKTGVVNSSGIYSGNGTSIFTDASGYSYITGSFTGPSFNLGGTVLNSTSGNFQTLFVAKYDPSGVLLWAKNTNNCYLSYGTSITVDTLTGRLYVVGVYATTGGNPTFGTQPFLAGFNSMFVAQLDAGNGNVLWLKCSSVGTPQNTNTASASGVTLDRKGNVYVTGSFKSAVSFGGINKTSVGYYDMYLAKYDTSGNTLWVKTAGYPWITGNQTDYQVGGTSLASDNAGYVYMVGQYKAGINIGTESFPGNASDHIFIAKFDTAGNYYWLRHSNGNSSSQAVAKIALDSYSNIYLSGLYGTNGIKFDALPLIPYTTGPAYNIFMAKYDSAGNAIWLKSPGGGFNCISSPSVAVDRNNSLYLTGNYVSAATFGSIILNPIINGNTGDVFVVKFDSAVNPLWAKSAGGNYSDYGRDAGIDYAGNVYITGSLRAGGTTATVIFDTINISVLSNQRYSVVAKLGSCIASQPVIASNGPTTICQGDSISLTSANSSGGMQWQSSSDSISYTDISGATLSGYSAQNITQSSFYRLKTIGCSIDFSTPVKISVTPLPSPLVSSIDTLICSGDSTQVCASGGLYYIWNTSDTSTCIYAKNAGGYWVTATGINGCTNSSARQNIDIYPIPSVSIVVQGDTLSSFGAVYYQWFRNNIIISGATGPVYIAQQSGDYSLEVTDANGCKARSTSLNVNINGLPDLANNLLSISPNPFADFISILNQSEADIEAVEVMDLCGRKVIAQNVKDFQNPLRVDLTSLPNGPYFLKISVGGAESIKKIIKHSSFN